jgi:hypothetical protein
MLAKDCRFMRLLTAALYLLQEFSHRLPHELGSVPSRARRVLKKPVEGGKGVLLNSHRNSFHIAMIGLMEQDVNRSIRVEGRHFSTS